MTTALSAFYPRIAPRVAGCPEPTIAQALLDTAIDFCTETHILTDFAQIASVAGTQTYTVPAPADTNLEVHSVRRAWFKEAELSPASDSLIDIPEAVLATTFGTQASGDPRRFLRTVNGTFMVYPVPNTAGSDFLTVFYSMKPKTVAAGVPDVLWDYWRDGLISGTLYRLRTIPGQPWTNDAKSDYNFYSYWRARAKSTARTGYSNAPIRVNTRGFGR